MKVCSTCGEDKPLSQYYKNGVDKDGVTRYRADCKTCYNIKKKNIKKTHTKFKNNNKLRTVDERTLTFEQWRDALIHWGGACAYCGYEPRKRKERLTKDHVVPLSEGGDTSQHNIIPACFRCNASKSNRLLNEWYPKQPFFTEGRYKKIREWCNVKARLK